MAARHGAIGSAKRANTRAAGCWEEAAKQKRRWEARGHTWWPSGCTWTPPPPHEEMDVNRMSFRRSSHTRVSRASTSGISKFLKQSRRKQSARIRKCICLPSNYALVEFPVVWSELRSVIIMRCRNQGSASFPETRRGLLTFPLIGTTRGFEIKSYKLARWLLKN